jgi:hypothetical protein
MNKTVRKLTLFGALLVSVTLGQPVMAATNYTDATGETFAGVGGGGILDITGVEVSNDPTDVIFKITYAADISSTDWGNYMIGINDPTLAGGSTTNNGWGRPITMANGMDYWVGTWVNGGNGGQFWTYSAGSWSQTGTAPTVTKSTYTETIRFPFANMGLSTNSGNNTFEFDIYTSGSGGGDSAIDALSTTNQSVANWGDPFVTTNVRSYTIQAVDNTPTNKVFFSVNMEVPMSIYDNSPPAGFDEGSDLLYVVGSFNGFTPSAPFQLYQVGTSTVFTNTVDVIANTNTTIQYKFKGVGFFNDFETPAFSCGGDRTLLITNSVMSAPAVYWSDSQLTDPTNTVTFQVDMLFPTAVAPGTNVYVRGNFNDWGNSQPPLLLTNVPSTTLWVGTLTLPYFPVGGCKPLQYKFVNGTTFESISDRTVNITTFNPILAATFNNVEACDVVEETNYITFSVNMTNAVGYTGSPVYASGTNVYINGDFLGWKSQVGDTADWGTNPKPELMLTNVPGTDVHSITLPFPAGRNLRLEYKYSMGGEDNESGGGQNHVRYIRTLPGQTSYSMPLDNWLSTNATYLATRTEPKFGLLTAAPGSPGQVSVQWLGLKCVQLQSSPLLSPASWSNNTGTDGTSATNLPASGGQHYFRLIDTSP